MRKQLWLAAAAVALAGLSVAGTAAEAQQARARGGAMMEGPRAPCRPAAMRFDESLRRMTGGAMTAGSTMSANTGSATMQAAPAASGAMMADEKVSKAAMMRNQGVEACQAGRAAEGQRMIEEATRSLGS